MAYEYHTTQDWEAFPASGNLVQFALVTLQDLEESKRVPIQKPADGILNFVSSHMLHLAGREQQLLPHPLTPTIYCSE